MKNWPTPARIAFAALVGLILGGGSGLLYLFANPGKPAALVLLVFTLVVGLAPAVSIYLMLWPSQRMRAEQRVAEHSVERRWVQEASSTAFWWLAALLILANVFGDLLHLTWLSPVTLVHVVVAAILAYSVSYLALRIRES